MNANDRSRDDARSIESPLLLYRRLKRRPAFVYRRRRDPMKACCAQRDLRLGLQRCFEETSDSCSLQPCRDGRRKTGFEVRVYEQSGPCIRWQSFTGRDVAACRSSFAGALMKRGVGFRRVKGTQGTGSCCKRALEFLRLGLGVKRARMLVTGTGVWHGRLPKQSTLLLKQSKPCVRCVCINVPITQRRAWVRCKARQGKDV